MKLSRDQLLHATDAQLSSVNVIRPNNSGWMQAALARDFTASEIETFEQIGRIKTVIGRAFCSPSRLRKAAQGTDDLFLK